MAGRIGLAGSEAESLQSAAVGADTLCAVQSTTEEPVLVIEKVRVGGMRSQPLMSDWKGGS